MQTYMMKFIFSIFDQKYPFLKKSGLNYEGSYKILFSLLDFIFFQFYFSKLVKIPENGSALLRYLLIHNPK